MPQVDQQEASSRAEFPDFPAPPVLGTRGKVRFAPRRGARPAPALGWAWLGLSAGLGALLVPPVVAAVAGVRLRGSERALASAAGAVAAAAVAKAVDHVSSRRASAAGAREVALHASVTINRPPGEVYRFWRELANLPLFMRHVESVTESGVDSSWRARGPLGTSLEWEARILEDEPNERIVWSSLHGASITNRGSVEFRTDPRGTGTELRVKLGFEPPAGPLGAGLARLFKALPDQWLENDLRRLRQILETGEVVYSDASIHRGPHPARAPRDAELPLVGGMVQS